MKRINSLINMIAKYETDIAGCSKDELNAEKIIFNKWLSSNNYSATDIAKAVSIKKAKESVWH